MKLSDLTMEELAAYICTAFEKQDIKIVLSGGSCMELYSNAMYSSYDIDFVMRYGYDLRKIEKTMVDIGFKLDGKYYVLEESQYFVEVLTPPVSVGDEFVNEFATRDTKLGTLHLLTPTDCVKDRLCGCYYHNDAQCFEQALAVAFHNDIDIENLRLWAEHEDSAMQEGVKDFLFSLEVLKKPTVIHMIDYLKQFCTKNLIDVSSDIGEQDLIDDLSRTYVGKVFFSQYSKKDIVDLMKNEKDKVKGIKSER
jgi:hypothetical protein